MCNDEAMNCLSLNLQAYECFYALLIGVNNQGGVIEINREG